MTKATDIPTSEEIINAHFCALLDRLKLSSSQKEDANKKYEGVAKCLHSAYYGTKYDGKTKLLIGSFAKHTNIRPPSDVDLIFKIPEETFKRFQSHAGNGPADLLQEVKTVLDKTYTSTEKHGWVKVVAVEFSDGTHNVEVLPGFEQGDKTFIIPNSSKGGSWEVYDVRTEIEKVTKVDLNARKLIKIIKHWRNGISQDIPSYLIEDKVLTFLESTKLSFSNWGVVVNEFFSWWAANELDCNFVSCIETAQSRTSKARSLFGSSKYSIACDELRKVFQFFPSYDHDIASVTKLSKLFPSDQEQFIEDENNVQINKNINLKIMATAKLDSDRTNKWGRAVSGTIDEIIRRYKGAIPPGFYITFTPKTNYSEKVFYEWKVRNFGQEAKENGQLRGEIKNGNLKDGSIVEPTRFRHSQHYVECYMIKDGVCISRARIFVPISGEENL